MAMYRKDQPQQAAFQQGVDGRRAMIAGREEVQAKAEDRDKERQYLACKPG